MLPYKYLHIFHKREIPKQKRAISALRSKIPLRRKSEESNSPRRSRLHRERCGTHQKKGAVLIRRKVHFPPLERMRSGLGTKPFHPMESSCDQRHEQQKSTGDKIRSSDGCIADRPALPYPKNEASPKEYLRGRYPLICVGNLSPGERGQPRWWLSLRIPQRSKHAYVLRAPYTLPPKRSD